MSKLNDLINEIVHLGISVTIYKDRVDNSIAYDLNTYMKSQCILKEKDGIITAYMRYNETQTIENLDDVLFAVKGCLHDRPFMSSDWEEVLLKEGYLTKKVETKTTVSYS